MGHKRIPTVYTLDKIKDEDGLVVRLKGLRIGKLRKLIRIMESDEAGVAEVLSETSDLLVESAVSWNLEEEDGTPIGFDRDGIESLELSQVMGILSAWMDAMTGVSEELGKDSTSGESFPGRPLMMEAL